MSEKMAVFPLTKVRLLHVNRYLILISREQSLEWSSPIKLGWSSSCIREFISSRDNWCGSRWSCKHHGGISSSTFAWNMGLQSLYLVRFNAETIFLQLKPDQHHGDRLHCLCYVFLDIFSKKKIRCKL